MFVGQLKMFEKHSLNNMTYERMRWLKFYYKEISNQMYRFFFTADSCKVCYSPIWRNMVFHYVRKPTNFLFNVLSGGCCRRNLLWTWAPSLPCFADKFSSSQYISTSLSEDGQSSFCPLSSSNYISIENCLGNWFLTHVFHVYV
jgi:uncharacterized membrane protein